MEFQRGAAYCNVLGPGHCLPTLLVMVQRLSGEGQKNKSAGTVATQTASEPERQPTPVAVTPAQKRKSKTRSVRIVSDKGKAGPSQSAEETETEIMAQSLSLGELQKEFTCWTDESIWTWLLRLWDVMAKIQTEVVVKPGG